MFTGNFCLLCRVALWTPRTDYFLELAAAASLRVSFSYLCAGASSFTKLLKLPTGSAVFEGDLVSSQHSELVLSGHSQLWSSFCLFANLPEPEAPTLPTTHSPPSSEENVQSLCV